jgi:hypothetical protein
MTEFNERGERALTRPSDDRLPVQPIQFDDWGEMGKAFDGMCKAGLALAVGFSVAAAFCKMMDNKNVNLPNVIQKLAGQVLHPEEEKRPRA